MSDYSQNMEKAITHLGQVAVLLSEAQMGYPDHKALAASHVDMAILALVDAGSSLAWELRPLKRSLTSQNASNTYPDMMLLIGRLSQELEAVRGKGR